MSKKRKKPKASMPTGIYDLDKILGQRAGFGKGGDELDQVLRDHRKRQADKIKSLQIEKIGLEIQRDVDKLKRGLEPSSAEGVSLSVEDAAKLAGLPEEQQLKALQVMAAYKTMSKGGEAGGLSPLLLVGLMQQKPQASIAELVTAMKGLHDMTKTDQQGMGNIATMLQISNLIASAKDTAYQTQLQLLQKQLEDVKPHDPVAYTKSLMEIATGMGFSPSTGQPNVELEKIKMDHASLLQKSGQDFQLLLRKMDRDDSRVLKVLETLTPAITNISQAASSRMTGARSGVTSLKCPSPECGFSPIFVSRENPLAICPKCGTPVTTAEYAQRMQQEQAAQQPVQSPQGPPQPQPGVPPEYRGDIQV